MFICLLAGLSNIISASSALIFLAISLSFLIIFFGNDLSVLYLMIALIPFYSSLNLGGLAFVFVLPFFASLKLLFKHFKISIPLIFLLNFIFLFFWFINDIQYQSIAAVLIRLCFPLYVFCVMSFVKLDDYNGYFSAWLVICSSLIAMFCVFIVQGGSLDSFIYASYAGEMRLGEADVDSGQKNQLGGAMGFPIYTITILTLVVQMFSFRKYTFYKKNIIIGVSVILFLITFLTLSRVYILGLLTMMLMLSVYYSKHFSIKHVVSIIFVFLGLFVIAVVVNPEIINSIAEQYSNRMEGESDNEESRILVYGDCLEYLLTHIKCFFLGEGNRGYIEIGKMEHTLMAISAHNIILDGMLSFGLFGCIILYRSYLRVYRLQCKHFCVRFNALRALPLGCVLMMYNTSSPFTLDKVWVFLLFLTLNIVHCSPHKRIN